MSFGKLAFTICNVSFEIDWSKFIRNRITKEKINVYYEIHISDLLHFFAGKNIILNWIIEDNSSFEFKISYNFVPQLASCTLTGQEAIPSNVCWYQTRWKTSPGLVSTIQGVSGGTFKALASTKRSATLLQPLGLNLPFAMLNRCRYKILYILVIKVLDRLSFLCEMFI